MELKRKKQTKEKKTGEATTGKKERKTNLEEEGCEKGGERERENEKQERKGVGGGWTKKEVGRRKGQRFWHPAESPNCLAILPSKRPARP